MSKKSKRVSARVLSTEPELGILNMPMDDPTNDIVALQDASLTATVGAYLQIDLEYMTVLDASDLSNLKVERGVDGTTIDVHLEGAEVLIGVTPEEVTPPAPTTSTDAQYLALVGAILYIRPGTHSMQECLGWAKNLLAMAEELVKGG